MRLYEHTCDATRTPFRILCQLMKTTRVWMATAEAAKALGVKPGAVLARIRCGKIEAQRVGPRWLVRVCDEQWVDGNGIPPHIKRMAELRAQGLTYAAIGAAVGLDGDTVLKHLKRRGLDTRPANPVVPLRV